ncbi:MAG: transporter [Verrucomicrobiaceae bacterium]|nr:transporter [Verrucomicrobiaceae bacterium]
MKTTHKQNFLAGLLLGMLALGTHKAQAEIGHYAPGLPNIRDFAVPEPGFYGAMLNYWYSTDRLNNSGGNKISTLTISPGPGPGLTLTPDIKVDLYALSPMFIWVSDYKILGAKYAAYVAPSFATSTISASLATARGRGRSVSGSSDFGLGDMFVQPLWLGWTKKHFDFAFGYGFYAPIGRYNTETVTLPIVGSFQTEAADNLGYGFWTNQLQTAATWYPWEDKRMAVAVALTYEIHGKKRDFDYTPGSNLTLNWGISQFLPLTSDQKLLLEIGPAGYSSWQVSDDKGSHAKNPNIHDSVHAVGGQLGLTYVPWMLSVNFRGMYEFAARDRFQGHSFGLNIAKKF